MNPKTKYIISVLGEATPRLISKTQRHGITTMQRLRNKGLPAFIVAVQYE